MNELMNGFKIEVTGKQNFMGKEIPVVLGGFGEGKKCIWDKTIAIIHGQPEREIRRRITDNIKRFRENVDFIDIMQRVGESHTFEMLQNIGYAKQSITQAEHIYLLSERGYAKLIKIMDTDLAWEIHDRLVDEYFELREKVKPLSQFEILQESLNILKDHSDRLDTMDTQISGIETKITDLEFDVPLYSCEAKELSDHVKRKGVEVLGGKNSNAYKNKSLRTKVYQDIYGVIKREFGLYGEDGKFQSYLSLTRRYKETAHKLVDKYEVPTFLYELICNENNVVAA